MDISTIMIMGMITHMVKKRRKEDMITGMEVTDMEVMGMEVMGTVMKT